MCSCSTQGTMFTTASPMRRTDSPSRLSRNGRLFWRPTIIYPTPTEIRDSEGVLTGLKYVCWCYGDNGTPNNPYDDIVSYDGSSAECDTAAITNAGGQFVNTECIKAACSSPCVFGPDPTVTMSLVEYPPGSGIWRDRRFKECRCP